MRWLALLLLVAACGKNKAVQYVEELADTVCACKDRACAEDVLAKGAERLLGEFKDAKGSEADLKAIEAAKLRIQECEKKLP